MTAGRVVYHVHDCGECGYWTPCSEAGDAYTHGCVCESCGVEIPRTPDGAA